MAAVTTAATAVAGLAFGFAIAAPPGPMNAIIAEESVLRGWSAGFRAGLGAMSADACFFLGALYGVVTFVGQYPIVRAVMVAIGGLLMWYFAYGAARDVNASFATASSTDISSTDALSTDASSTDAPGGGGGDIETANAEGERTDTTGSGRTGFTKAFVLAITNPYQIVFWLTIGVSLLRPGRLDVFGGVPYLGTALRGALVVSTGSPLLLIGFFCGIALWITGFPATLVLAGRRTDAFAPAVALASAVVLAVFGAIFLADAATTMTALV